MDYQVKRYMPDDENELFSFRETIFNPGSKHLERNFFRWKFLKHPHVMETPLFVLESEGRIVGTQGYWPIPLSVDGRDIMCGQLVDFNAAEAFRGMPVLKLFKATCSETDVSFATNLSPDARRFFGAARWKDISPALMTFELFLSPPEDHGIAGMIKFHGKKFLAMASRMRAFRKRSKDSAIELSDRLPAGIETITEGCPSNSRVYLRKNRDYLAWRYRDPGYRFLTLSVSGELKAAIVFLITLDNNRKTCFIMDMLHDHSDLVSAEILLCGLIEHCKEQNDIVCISTTSFPWLAPAFRACGFRGHQSSLGFVVNGAFLKELGDIDTFSSLNFMLGDTDLM